ncbi:polysaccharide biosynthesis/export family protein [Sphingomonas bisphenolicum]|nr:polysaccharide biosynthesis/export family protein [Sphingomonas bisphenolicum]
MIIYPTGIATCARLPLIMALTLSTFATTGCSSFSAMGPSSRDVVHAAQAPDGAQVYLIDLTKDNVNSAQNAMNGAGFADTMGGALPVGTIIHAGDVLSIAIWEAPPAVLFNATPSSTRSIGEGSALAQGNGSSTARQSSFPDQVVISDGTISVPFAGQIPVEGRTTRQVANEIARRLRGKAHMPQVEVAFSRNASATATMVGEFENNGVIPLTAKGERVLDAIALSGGTKQPINKTTIQITRAGVARSLPLETIIRDPRQNVVLAPGDIMSAYFQPLSFTALGAIGQSREVSFESTGLSLIEALGRVGGLHEDKANPAGAFLFRFEDARALGLDPANPVRQTEKGPVRVAVDAQGRVGVIYRVNLRDPATFFAAQNFAMRDKDILYVSNAPIVDVQKFVGIISSTIFPIISLNNAITR